MEPLTIVAYFDGRLGHEKQTHAILNSLAEITATTVIHKRAAVSPAASLKNWVKYLLPPLRSLQTKQFFNQADLVIGAGTHTHIPMLLEKEALTKLYGRPVRVVTCMSPEVILHSQFDLCCIPQHDDPPLRENVFITQGPPCPVHDEKKHNPTQGLILLGGLDKKSHIWHSRTVVEQVHTIVHQEPNRQWTVSSSPRTPEDTCKKMESMAGAVEHLTFYRAKDTERGWIEEQYALNQTVWVTADSVSMVYEALTAGCSVGILPVTWLHQDNKFQKSLDILHEKKMTVYFNEWLAGAQMPVPPVEPFNEAGRCAREILRRWWPNRLHADGT